jgi:arylsulfatase A-like enzyme
MELLERRLSLLLLAGTLGLAACSDSSPAAPPASARYVPPAPVNVVLIVVDTLRADAVNDPAGRYETPNIDRLARDGVLFPRAFASAPMTLPSHTSLFSSRPPFETGVLNNGQKVPKELPLVADWLGQNGYDTRAVISLGTLNPLDADKSTGPGRGFDHYDVDYWDIALAAHTDTRLRASLAARARNAPLYLFAHFADPHEPYDAHGSEVKNVDVFLDGNALDQVVSSDTNQWTRELELTDGRNVFEFQSQGQGAQRFRVRRFECVEDGRALPVDWELGQPMERLSRARVVVDRGEQPDATCRVRFWVNDVPASDDVRRQRYALEVAYTDRYIGALLDELERQGLYQDSLIVFTSDHGEALGEKKLFGHVERLSDELIQVPLIVKLPKSDPRRAELERAARGLTSHVDLVPTILDAVGLPPLPGQRGTSLFVPHETVHIAETHRPEAKRTQLALRDERFKMVFFPADAELKPPEERFELYDLVADPLELTDVFAARARERPEWPERLRLLHHQSTGGGPADGAEESEEERRAREEMLRALGYIGGDDDASE